MGNSGAGHVDQEYRQRLRLVFCPYQGLSEDRVSPQTCLITVDIAKKF